MPSNPKITTPSLKKCRSLNSFTSTSCSKHDSSLDDSHIAAHEISFTALPPPQPFVKSTLPVHLSATVDAQAPYKILSTSIDLCKMLDLSMTELQDRSLRILFGPETDMSAVSSAMKTVNIDKERKANIPEIKIYGRNGTSHLFEVHCVLLQKCKDEGHEACSIMMMFKSIQDQHQHIARSSRRSSLPALRNEARSRYNFITGLGLHNSVVQSPTLEHLQNAGC
jgi:hypothetical protein